MFLGQTQSGPPTPSPCTIQDTKLLNACARCRACVKTRDALFICVLKNARRLYRPVRAFSLVLGLQGCHSHWNPLTAFQRGHFAPGRNHGSAGGIFASAKPYTNSLVKTDMWLPLDLGPEFGQAVLGEAYRCRLAYFLVVALHRNVCKPCS